MTQSNDRSSRACTVRWRSGDSQRGEANAEEVRESIERLRTCVMFQLEPCSAVVVIGPDGARVLSDEERDAYITAISGPAHEDADDDKKHPK
jgi:hypothetical protein